MFSISTDQLSYLTKESKNLSVGKCKTFQQQLKKKKTKTNVVISFLLSEEVKNISEFHKELQQALGEKLSLWFAKYKIIYNSIFYTGFDPGGRRDGLGFLACVSALGVITQHLTHHLCFPYTFR